MDLREVFATNLRRLRHEKGLSQDDLAYEAEVSRSYLSQLEKGAFYASLKIIGKLAEALIIRPLATACWWSLQASSTRCVAPSKCGAKWQNETPPCHLIVA